MQLPAEGSSYFLPGFHNTRRTSEYFTNPYHLVVRVILRSSLQIFCWCRFLLGDAPVVVLESHLVCGMRRCEKSCFASSVLRPEPSCPGWFAPVCLLWFWSVVRRGLCPNSNSSLFSASPTRVYYYRSMSKTSMFLAEHCSTPLSQSSSWFLLDLFHKSCRLVFRVFCAHHADLLLVSIFTRRCPSYCSGNVLVPCPKLRYILTAHCSTCHLSRFSVMPRFKDCCCLVNSRQSFPSGKNARGRKGYSVHSHGLWVEKFVTSDGSNICFDKNLCHRRQHAQSQYVLSSKSSRNCKCWNAQHAPLYHARILMPILPHAGKLYFLTPTRHSRKFQHKPSLCIAW